MNQDPYGFSFVTVCPKHGRYREGSKHLPRQRLRGRMTCQDEEKKRFSTSPFGDWDVRVSEWVIK